MQILFFNGPVITMENKTFAESLLAEDGVIRAVGPLSKVKEIARKDAKQVNLKGRTLMPAFIDAHSHFLSASAYFTQISLNDAKSFDDIKNKISAYIKERGIKAGEWVRARGYDQNFLKEGRHPNALLLDKASPENPVVLGHVSGHMGVFNSLAMKLLKVPSKEDAVPGGFIAVENGHATGYMEENAYMKFFREVPHLTLKDLFAVYDKVENLYLENGITFAQEGCDFGRLLPWYRALAEHDRPRIDITGYCGFGQADYVKKAFGSGPRFKHLKFGGYKVFLDGSPQGRTAWMREPYIGSDYRGYGILSDETLYENICLALSENKQILAHCNGDAAAEQYIRAFEKSAEKGLCPAKIRPVMIHAQLLGRDQIPRMKALGIIPSFFIAHVYQWGDVHIENFGRERADYISPAGSALRYGIPFTFHQDTPVLLPDMIKSVECAVNRTTEKGVRLSRNESIDVYEALKAVTVNAAYQYFEEDVRGSLKAGKKADLVILSQNPLCAPKEELGDIKVLATFKDGECLWHI